MLRLTTLFRFRKGARQIYQTLNYSIDIAIGKRAMQWMMKITRKRKMNEKFNYRGTVRIPETSFTSFGWASSNIAL